MVALAKDRRQRSASRLPVSLIRRASALYMLGTYTGDDVERSLDGVRLVLPDALTDGGPHSARMLGFALSELGAAVANWGDASNERRGVAAALVLHAGTLLRWADRAERAMGAGL